MARPEYSGPRLHEDAALFREAVSFTAAQTGFAPRLVEKDYFCSAVIAWLAQAGGGTVFKGGTCLAKVHADFYRLSEDLDWAIPTPLEATRSQRSALAAAAKKALARPPEGLGGLSVRGELKGANKSTQYLGTTAYRSLLSGEEEPLKIEIGLREPLLTPVAQRRARTLLLDPISADEAVPPIEVPCISVQEAYAEKLRAALTRREPAARDLFDVDYAIRAGRIREDDPELLEMTGRKLAVPDNPPPDVSDTRLEALRRSTEAQLKPVLRPADFESFDVGKAVETLRRIAQLLADRS
jgi:predicted nucleotidyltransferase component of viral defense system